MRGNVIVVAGADVPLPGGNCGNEEDQSTPLPCPFLFNTLKIFTLLL